MTPFAENGAVHAFNPLTSSWRRLSPSSSSSSFPCARSYHASTASSTHLIIHAGCGDASTGRLKDTWAFEPTSREWAKLPDAPGDPRGGTAITWAKGKVWRFGGFNGKTEIGEGIDYLPFSGTTDLATSTWSSIPYPTSAIDTGPGARSVAALHPLGNSSLVALFGEGKPSPTGGHDSAGNFWGDVWSFDPSSESWKELNIGASKGEAQGEGPVERGWFGSDTDDQGRRVVVWGGIDKGNERLGDGWVLSRG